MQATIYSFFSEVSVPSGKAGKKCQKSKSKVITIASCALDSHYAASTTVFVILMSTLMRVDQFNNTASLQLIIYPPNSIKLAQTWPWEEMLSCILYLANYSCDKYTTLLQTV